MDNKLENGTFEQLNVGDIVYKCFLDFNGLKKETYVVDAIEKNYDSRCKVYFKETKPDYIVFPKYKNIVRDKGGKYDQVTFWTTSKEIENAIDLVFNAGVKYAQNKFKTALGLQ